MKKVIIILIVAFLLLASASCARAETPQAPTLTPSSTEGGTRTPPEPHPWTMMLYSVFLWENGKEEFIAGANEPLTDFLLKTLPRLNLQASYVFSDEQIEDIKKYDKAVNLRFRFAEDVTISQWIKPEDRDHIKTDEKGYRILENVKFARFILEDNRGKGLKGHILVGSATPGFWSCWAIQQEGSDELDKTWIAEVERMR